MRIFQRVMLGLAMLIIAPADAQDTGQLTEPPVTAQAPTRSINRSAASDQAAGAPGGAPTVDQLILLKTIGFNEDQIKAELEPFKNQLYYSAEGLSQLEQAGFSTSFVIFVASLQPTGHLDNADIAAFLDQGMTVDAILDEVSRSQTTFDTSASAMLKLQAGRQLPVAVTKAMLGQPLTAQDLKILAESRTSESQLLKLIALVGHRIEINRASDALVLANVGIPTAVLQELRAPKSLPTGTAEPVPITATPENVELERFTHVTNLFSFSYPRDWFFERNIKGEATIYYASPVRPRDGDAAQLRADTTAVTLRYWPRENTQRAEAADPTLLLSDNLSRLFTHVLDDIKPLGEVDPITIDGRSAAYRDYEARVDGKTIGFRWYLVIAEDFLIGLMAHTPKDKFEQQLPLFARLAREVTIGGTPFAARSTGGNLTSGEIVSRYKKAVVMVRAGDEPDQLGNGTGFFIRRDGFLLTNHHVIWNEEAERPYRYIRVAWSSELGLEEQGAELIDLSRRKSSIGTMLSTGEDLALLRVASTGVFDAIPLSPIDQVEVGDPLITIGFPITQQFDDRAATTVSSGVVTRFVRDGNNRVETIITDAKIAPGNSGGPAISLVTGGAIGLNTRGIDAISIQEFASPREDPSLRHAVGYYGIMPVERAIERFPQQTMVTAERDQGLDAIDAFDLARFTYQQGWRAGAIDLARKAAQQAPSSAASHHLYARALLTPDPDRTEDDVLAGERALKRALEIDPSFQEALYTKADYEIDRGEYLEAVKAANRVIETNETWVALVKRARIYKIMEQYDDALRDLDRAKELSGNSTLEPFILAGEIKYAQKKYEEGLAEYQAAVQIAPASADARLGVGHYYFYEKKYLAALLEYDRIRQSEVKNPDIYASIGRAYARQGDYVKAIKSFLEAIKYYQVAERVPPEDVLAEASETAGDKLLGREGATVIYAYYLGHYYDSRRTLAGHRYLANYFREKGAIRRAHLNRAIELKGGEQDDERSELERQFEQVKGEVLTIDDIRTMRAVPYSSRLVIDFIENNPGRFSLPGYSRARLVVDEERKEALQKLAEEFGTDVVMAIYDHVLEREGLIGDSDEQRQEYQDGGRSSLVGTWFREAHDGRAEIKLESSSEYVITLFKAGQEKRLSEGAWELVPNRDTFELHLKDQDDVHYKFPMRIVQGDDGYRLLLTQRGVEHEYRRTPD